MMLKKLQEIAPTYANWRYGRIENEIWIEAKTRWQTIFFSEARTFAPSEMASAFEGLASIPRTGDPRWVWGTLCECLQDAELPEELWTVLEGFLASWPLSLRRVPDAWASQVTEGHEPPKAWRLCKMMDLSHRDIPARFLPTLFENPALASLVHLDLSSNGLREAGFRYLAASPYLSRLRRLDLRDVGLGDKGAMFLAASTSLAPLHSLDLSANALSEEACRTLFSPPTFSSLRALNLGGTELDAAGLRIVVQSPTLASLTKLLLWNNQFCGEALTALASAPFLPTLEELDLSNNALGDRGAILLAEVTPWGCLQTLLLRSCEIERDGVAALSRALFPSLRALNLVLNPIQDEGLRSLLSAPYLPHLRNLLLRKTGITAEGLLGLLALSLPSLEKLDLSLNLFSSEELQTLPASDTFQALLRSNKIIH